ncbi:hypothetical protein FAUST_6318 [Fusarium austroamericanum]|uniref:Glucan 1, 4-alpha-glucosidase n=1 Tax=Fusarium austroamericanum TaxID=282268 RepID=A0AAN6BZN0_FUSAU|nr:hypothetical protein FAUST_6318 [Fusarium austroamericanum]
MEDPWGSPWTNDSPPKIDLPAPPPNAHFTADHLGSSQRASPALAPWNDEDDAWGGWTEAGKDGSPRWGRSPGLRPIGGSPSGSRLPSPTPDPWGRPPTFDTVRSKKEDNGDSAISLGEGLRPILGRVATRSPSPARSFKENTADIWQQPDPALSIRSLTPLPNEYEGRPGSPDGAPRPALQPETRQPPLRQSSNKVSELVEMFDDISKRNHSVSPVDPSMQKVSGNASSAGDVASELGANGLEEPEDDLKTKTDSGMELEDDLKTEEEPEPKLPEPEAKESESEAELESESELETETRFEDASEELPKHETEVVENETKELSKEEGDQTESDSWSDFESPPQDTLQQETQGPEPEAPDEQPLVVETSTEEETPAEPAPVRPKPPLEPFAIDMSKLDVLFPSVDTSFPSPEPVPDVIIDDSFTAISERKAWYLMSRPGSMRKHNMGDDENYVRVGWNHSHVREQSIRIVRRWMEEDSITGRVVLGRRGGAAGAKIFNWDSSAPSTEFSISELLARKNHSRQTSAASKGVASPTAASFGWGHAPLPSPTAAAPPSAPRTSDVSEPEPASTTESSPVEATKISPVSKTRPPPLDSPPRPRIVEEPPSPIKPIPLEPTNRPISISQPLPFPSSPTISEPQSPMNTTALLGNNRPVSISQAPRSPLAQPPTNAGWGDDEDDDDDWGDMVSSPTVETNGGFASMNAIVNAERANDKENTGKSLIAGQSPMVESFKDEPEVETQSNGRLSMDTLAVPSQNLVPNNPRLTGPHWNKPQALQNAALGHSRSTTIDLLTSPRKVPMPGHLRSTTIDLGNPRSPLNGFASANLTPTEAKSSVEQTNKANSWDSWGLGLIDDSSRPVSPEKDSAAANQTPQTLTTPLDTLKGNSTLKKPRPMSLPLPPRLQTITASSEDDEIVVNILRDLPDLSYMLR